LNELLGDAQIALLFERRPPKPSMPLARGLRHKPLPENAGKGAQRPNLTCDQTLSAIAGAGHFYARNN